MILKWEFLWIFYENKVKMNRHNEYEKDIKLIYF